VLATVPTEQLLFPGQVTEITYVATPADEVATADAFLARIRVDPAAPTFHECRDDNNESALSYAVCID
jgi:hypothetical protein